MHKRIMLVIGLALLALGLVWGCGKPEEPAQSRKAELPARDQCPRAAAVEVGQNQIYDEPEMPVRTQYPDNMTAAGSCSGEGCGFTFRFKDGVMDHAAVHIYLPRGTASAAAQEPFVTGERGLLENNGWQKKSESQNSSVFPYVWVKKIIDFADPGNKDLVGEILLGEAEGQAVQVILYYPGDRSKEFIANARIILGNLHFKDDKLPVGRAR